MIVSAVLICLLLQTIGTLCQSESSLSWEEYKVKFGKKYSYNEDLDRKKVFEKKKAEVEQFNSLNSGKSRFKKALNHFSDLNLEELEQYKNSFTIDKFLMKLEATENNKAFSNILSRNGSLPESVDWSQDPSRVSRVKNQGPCSACWAFMVTGLLEGQQHLFSEQEKVNPLSEQCLIDCTFGVGCQEGSAIDALHYILTSSGLPGEHCYPYRGKKGECKVVGDDCIDLTTSKLAGFSTSKLDEDSLKHLIAEYGPVGLLIAGLNKRELLDYGSGLYSESSDRKWEVVDHSMLAVGYGTDEQGDFWLLKNSWGPEWGLKGFVKVPRNEEGGLWARKLVTTMMVSFEDQPD